MDLQAEAPQGQLHPELAALTPGAAPPRVALQAPGGSLLLSDITEQHLHPLHGTGRLSVLVFLPDEPQADHQAKKRRRSNALAAGVTYEGNSFSGRRVNRPCMLCACSLRLAGLALPTAT